jgi:tetratricopeptide (TPR) repeat protein
MTIKLTSDEGIIKIPIIARNDLKISWIKGMNARFHYTAHAYLAPKKDCQPDGNQESHNNSHNHKHDLKCRCDSQEARQKKLEMIQNLLDGKKNPSENAPEVDPNLKPVRTLIADSRRNHVEPFELRIGYSFSVKALEICVKSLTVGERARFLCMPDYVEGFIQLEMIMRQEAMNKKLIAQGKPPINISGCAAHMDPVYMELSRGLEDAIGAPIEFEIELVSVQEPLSFVREPWEMTEKERYDEIPKLKEQGGLLYNQSKIEDSFRKYERCLVLLESLASSSLVLDMKKEEMDLKRGIQEPSLIPQNNQVSLKQIDEWNIACRLNYALCKLKLKDYKVVIIQCTHILTLDPSNVKALFRRGQAYLHLGRDLDLASKDFKRLESIVEPNTAESLDLKHQKKLLDAKFTKHAEKEKSMFGGKLLQ